MNDELEGLWNKVFILLFELIPQHLSAGTEKMYENLRLSSVET